MALECFTWTAQLLGSLFGATCKDETFGRLPDCLTVDILCRLPADSLLSCRRVCRDWRALLSSHYFNTLHLGRPTHLIQDNLSYRKKHGLQDLYVFGTENRNREKGYRKVHLRPELMINKHLQNIPTIRYSCEGVLLFIDWLWESTYYVLNPITQEEVTVQHELHPGNLCALYLCPVTREFKLLYAQRQGSLCQYLVYIFKTKTWRKIPSSTFNLVTCSCPAALHGALHWITSHDLEKRDVPPCENGIMVFRMDKEELSAMPHPGSVCDSKNVFVYTTMTLLVKDGCLAFCRVLLEVSAVDIWILEDYEMRRWSKRYKVKLRDETIFPFRLCKAENKMLLDLCSWIELLRIEDGELLFYFHEVGCIWYNLDHKTAKRFEGPRVESFPRRYTCSSYIKSLLAIA